MLRQLLAGAVLFVGLSIGWQLRATWALIGDARAATQVTQIVADQSNATAAADDRFAAAVATTRPVYRTLYREIPVHVPAEAIDHCDLPVGFVRLHDAAAKGVPVVPDAAGRADAEASGIGLDRVAGVVVDNYETCNRVREQLLGLQDWVTAQAAID